MRVADRPRRYNLGVTIRFWSEYACNGRTRAVSYTPGSTFRVVKGHYHYVTKKAARSFDKPDHLAHSVRTQRKSLELRTATI